jgi:nucleotide-binding universal stress UspA family protein
VITSDDRPILLCYDRTASSRHAIEAAGALFRGRRAIVLYVYLPSTVMAAEPRGTACTEETLRQGALKLAGEGVRVAVSAGLDAAPEVAGCANQGIDHVILDAAAQFDAGLIVLGSRAGSSFPFPPGSVSHGVAQRTFLPILLVPATQFPSADAARDTERAAHERTDA